MIEFEFLLSLEPKLTLIAIAASDQLLYMLSIIFSKSLVYHKKEKKAYILYVIAVTQNTSHQ